MLLLNFVKVIDVVWSLRITISNPVIQVALFLLICSPERETCKNQTQRFQRCFRAFLQITCLKN